MFPKHLRIPLILLSCFALLVALAPDVRAAESFLPACVSNGYCTLCDIMQTAINFGKFLLGIVGSLALLMFVYGGFTWLTSGGESGKIDAGKKILINSVIGVGITFFSWIIVSFVVSTLTSQSGWKWDADLTCAPLDDLEKVVLEDRDYPDADTGTGTDSKGTKKEGERCVASAECIDGLYCEKGTTVCTKKKSSTTEELVSGQCEGKEIAGSDNLVCLSGDCITARDIEAIATTCDRGYCCGEGGNLEENKDCTGQNCSDGLYCQVLAANSARGKCVPKNDVDQNCEKTTVLGGDANLMCTSNKCSGGKCVEDAPIGNIGDKCSVSTSCRSPYYCKVSKVGDEEGRCQPDITVGQSCANPMEIKGMNLYICKDGVCNEFKKCQYALESKLGEIGEYCTIFSQCKSESCKCEGEDTIGVGPKCEEGTCASKIIKGDLRRFCNGWETKGAFDGKRCVTNCKWTGPYKSRCEP